MAFIETPRFPDDLSVWAVGGRGSQTSVVRTMSGFEYRNSEWTTDLGEWEISKAFRATDWQSTTYNQASLLKFLRVCRGQWGGFRFKDFMDFKDDGNGILGLTGLAVAATVAYQMYKGYSISPLSYLQIVNKPVGSSIKIYDNGVLKTITTDYTIDTVTGIVTFTSQPTIGHTLSWTGEFDIAVRFAIDTPMLGLDNSGALAAWDNMKLIELRNP